MTAASPALLDLTLPELTEWMVGLGFPKFRAGQVYTWLMKGKRPGEMNNVPLALREALAQNAHVGGVTICETLESPKDGTRKYLYELEDGNILEGVLLRYHHGNTLCVSTQVGCRMGCAFCASTGDGLIRNLTPGEILGQVIAVNADLGGGRSITNLVLMGSGEPLDNYDNTLKFIRLASCGDGLGISQRNISLSTCGLVERIDQLAQEGLHITLCISLHSALDEKRRQIMPIARKWTVAQTVNAARAYAQATGRRVIFEYALTNGINDTCQDADALATALKGLPSHVNVIPLNAADGSTLSASEHVEAFLKMLEDRGVSATRRRTLGEDIEGACGQLRRRRLQERAEKIPE
ncbi:MAG: 23S rRNA (adenine(2503)-C(2))-methyltransferase RlmN [Eubacteriales bacterium]|nr:23S rRNA (adenine(2503)-C(2))-methyltransferase RlmN [Eubacteriales bacterium]